MKCHPTSTHTKETAGCHEAPKVINFKKGVCGGTYYVLERWILSAENLEDGVIWKSK
jgi:hypothetical protein